MTTSSSIPLTTKVSYGGVATDFMWPQSLHDGACCAWCGRDMKGVTPFFCPVSFLPPSTFTVSDVVYCHPSCALAYLVDIDPPPDRIFWLQNLAKQAGYEKAITPAPHRHALSRYRSSGGMKQDEWDEGRASTPSHIDPLFETNFLCSESWSVTQEISSERTRRRSTRHEFHLELPISQLFSLLFHEGKVGKLPNELDCVVSSNSALSNLWSLELLHHYGLYNVKHLMEQWGSRRVWGDLFRQGSTSVKEEVLAVIRKGLSCVPEVISGEMVVDDDIMHVECAEDVSTSRFDKFIEAKGAPTEEEKAKFKTSSRRTSGITATRRKASSSRAKKTSSKSGSTTNKKGMGLFEKLLRNSGSDGAK